MTYEEAIARFKSFGTFCDDLNDACDGECKACGMMESAIIEALEKQSDIVHCKDCKNWSYPLQIECLDGRSGTVGQCVLTGWLCGKQGYCMYGSEVE